VSYCLNSQGVTMGIIEFELNRLRQQEIEVKALIALMKHGRTHGRKVEAEARLCLIAFPETVAENIKQETLGYCGCEFCKSNKAAGRVYDLHCKEL